MSPLVSGKGIENLIPQRAPVVVVGALLSYSEWGAETSYVVEEDSWYSVNGHIDEQGIMEHVAQSAAAWGGYPGYLQGKMPKLGYVAEFSKFEILRMPGIGSELRTTLTSLGSAAGVTLMEAETVSGGKIVAHGKLKIYLEQ